MNSGRSETIVTGDNTAQAVGSGVLPVFSTPSLAALMEAAACDALRGALEEGVTTVGTQIHVQHLSATPVGMRVWAEATLTEQSGREYAFDITAFDEAGVIGRASHRRAAVKTARFMEKTQAKRGNHDA